MAERSSATERGERALQRRWAESSWAAPFIDDGGGGQLRVIWPGRWNHGPGPDFHGAQFLDAGGRALRGDVELHLRAAGWIAHGHHDDAAYDRVVLHVVERPATARSRDDPRIPQASPLPMPLGEAAATALPCEGIVEHAGALAVEARLLQVAERRFARKARELTALLAPNGPGDEADRRALLATARALGQPHNAELALAVAQAALDGEETWSAAALNWNLGLQAAASAGSWRRGRGVLGSAAGMGSVLTSLLERWSEGTSSPWTAYEALAELELPEALGRLHLPQRLGAARARQLLADAVYPLTGAWSRWLALPGARYQRTDELRERISGGLRWRHPLTQALLELEATRCRQAACRICPLGQLSTRRQVSAAG